MWHFRHQSKVGEPKQAAGRSLPPAAPAQPSGSDISFTFWLRESQKLQCEWGWEGGLWNDLGLQKQSIRKVWSNGQS